MLSLRGQQVFRTRTLTLGRDNQTAITVPSGKDVSASFPTVPHHCSFLVAPDFEVTSLPSEIPTGLPRSFAGNINVNRAGHNNDTLFFWGFEREGANGTLTAAADESNTDPWILWLQGG